SADDPQHGEDGAYGHRRAVRRARADRREGGVSDMAELQTSDKWVFGQNIAEPAEETIMERKKRIYFARKAELEGEQAKAIKAAKVRHQAELNAIGDSFNEAHRDNAKAYGLR